MLVLSSIGARLIIVGSSALIHASVFVALAGHGPSRAASLVPPVDGEIRVEVEEPAPAVIAPEPPAEPERHVHAVPHSHVHPYPVPAGHDATPHDPSQVHVPIAADHAEPAPATAPPEVLIAPVPTTVRFAVPVGTVSSSPARFPRDTNAGGTANGSGEGAPVLEAAQASVPARLLQATTPRYPSEARAEEIEADVPMEIVVDTLGNVTDARVVRHVGYGFDAAALGAISFFRFSPAERDGHAIRVRMKWSVVFRLK